MKRLALVGVVLMAATGVVVESQVRQVRPQLLGVPTADAFFDDTVLHEIRLTISERDWQSLRDHYLEDTYYPSDFKWRDRIVRNIGIRSRGTGSRSGIKPGLRVTFDRYVGGQRFLDLKTFILRNQTQDASNLHERLTMLLFRRLGLLAEREAHTKLFVNERYAGLYTIVEAVDEAFLKRNVGEDDGYLYKYNYPADAQPYFFEDRGSSPATYVPQPFQPYTHESDPRPEFIVDLVKTINLTSSAAFPTVMADYFDLRKFLRHVAVEQFVAELDGFLSDYGGMNNYFIYRFNGKKLFTFIAWDKSEAFKGGPFRSIFHNITGVPENRKNRLLERTLLYRDLYDAYLDAILDCVRSAYEVQPDGRGWLEREIEHEYSQIRDAALSDPEKPFSNADFESRVDDLRAFARQRGDLVTREVNASR